MPRFVENKARQKQMEKLMKGGFRWMDRLFQSNEIINKNS